MSLCRSLCDSQDLKDDKSSVNSLLLTFNQHAHVLLSCIIFGL